MPLCVQFENNTIFLLFGKGCLVFHPHALLMRGTFYILWRDTTKALLDLDAVINIGGVSNMVFIVKLNFPLRNLFRDIKADESSIK